MRKSNSKVGMRFTTSVKNKAVVEKIYKQAGFSPVGFEYSDDGHVTFIFAKLPDEEMFGLINATPRKYSSISGVVVGSQDNQK